MENDEHITRTGPELIDLPAEDRQVQIEPLCSDEEKLMALLEGRSPRMKGFGFHCHTNVPVIDENGSHIETRCDYIVMDLSQVMQLKEVLSHVIVMKKDGTPIDE